MKSGSAESPESANLVARACAGDNAALNELLALHRDRLRRMVHLRLDRRLQGRIDASDVIQEAYLEASDRFADFAAQQEMPFYIWLRFLTAQKLLVLHRRHLGSKMRDASREISIYHGSCPEASSAALAAQLLGHRTSPSQAAIRAEMQSRLQDALNTMEPIDREILALRHFEQLSNGETARVLGLRESAASQRYARALLRLKDLLLGLPGGPFEGRT